ncbi:SLC13 family permease [Microbulbifer yueqingensis]|uniref:Solute carrier family 13 (Sodium-dependent dicarboxylate transporter), member 2/3/5 n=1 Tax=Microbulbifer yueqingensis TaxID=658219 RepID=A0A1G9C0E1_9GAMM|nr:SLC13 family permease [Microbulbifer yueqingensis]SDK45146.1 solute carrier family 13 (sodium-dependent dicarboxylate transporter), member 2/3/5 [Microbulbifer yueqingensis]
MSKLSLPARLAIIAGWILFAWLLAGALVVSGPERLGFFILAAAAGLWMSEIIPLPVTALLVPAAAYFTGLLPAAEALAPFASTIIFLFMGGFTLAAVLHAHGIDRRLAGRVLRLGGGHLWPTLVGFFLTVSFLSMWISNTATSAMMLPIALSLVDRDHPRTRTFAVLGTAYAANIGGLATIVGSPPNAIAARALGVDFISWLQVGLPVTLGMFPLVLASLWLVLRPDRERAEISKPDLAPVPWTAGAIGAIALFAVAVLAWTLSTPLTRWLGLGGSFDAVVGLCITALAPLCGLISWPALQSQINWGILLLFGGGLCLSLILQQTGTSVWIAQSLLGGLGQAPGWLLVAACIALMIFLTELASNTGSAAILVPVFYGLAQQFDPGITEPLILGIGMAASCAFMLPVATPPNALAYGTGVVRQDQMLRAGLILNLLAIPVVWIMVSWLAR